MNDRAVRVLLAILVLAAATAAPTAAQRRPFTLDDTRLITLIDGLALSPDGTVAVLTTTVWDYEENEMVSALDRVDLGTGDRRSLTPHRPGVRSAAWSPDGSRLAFVDGAVEGRGPQIFVLPMTGGEARQVTRAPEGVASFAWSADGLGFFYTSRDPAPRLEGEERHNRSFAVGDHSSLTREAPRPAQLWYQALDGGEAERLTEGPETVGGLRVSPDGRTLALALRRSPETGARNETVLRLLDLESGETRELDNPPGTYLRGFSPDGRYLAIARPRGAEPAYTPDGIFLVSVAGGTAVDVSSDIDRDLGAVEWLPDGHSMLVTGVDGTRSIMWQVFVDGSPSRRIAFEGIALGGKEATPDGRLVFVGSEPQRPTELYVAGIGDWEPRRITDYNESFEEIALGRVETVNWDGPDGFRLNGVLTYPPDYQEGERYPLVLNIHGGPMDASINAFDVPRQAMAAQGWLVFSPNYRGSSSQGIAFQSAVLGDAGDGPARDVMSGVAFLKERGIVDEDRIAVSGWSYGGFMTTWLTAHYDGWAAAVAGAAVTDFVDSYNTADITDYFRVGMGGSPWVDGNDERYREQSPITYAHQIRTPTLILATIGDERVPVGQSYKLYHALKDNGVPVKFVAYPVPGHFPSDPVHRRDVVRRWIEWIAERFQDVEPR